MIYPFHARFHYSLSRGEINCLVALPTERGGVTTATPEGPEPAAHNRRLMPQQPVLVLGEGGVVHDRKHQVEIQKPAGQYPAFGRNQAKQVGLGIHISPHVSSDEHCPSTFQPIRDVFNEPLTGLFRQGLRKSMTRTYTIQSENGPKRPRLLSGVPREGSPPTGNRNFYTGKEQ